MPEIGQAALHRRFARLSAEGWVPSARLNSPYSGAQSPSVEGGGPGHEAQGN